MGYFWSDLLPAMRRQWRKDGIAGVFYDHKANNFPYDMNEVRWAFANYHDAYGPLMTTERAQFKRCSCVDKNGHRKPCVPPRVGYMCQRMATFVKMRIMRVQDKAERVWNTYKTNGLIDAVKRAEHEAWAYLNSRAGVRWMQNKSYAKAEELVEERGVDGLVLWKAKKADAKKKKILRKWDRKMAKLKKARDAKLVHIDAQLEKLTQEENAAKEGYYKISIQAKISTLINQKGNLNETKLLRAMQSQAESECLQVIITDDCFLCFCFFLSVLPAISF